MSFGDESVVFFEIDQPFCSLTYGVAPCTAVLGTTGAAKCYQSRATCQAPSAYSPDTLTLRFARPQEGLEQYGYVIASMLDTPRTSPGAINLGGMDTSVGALGRRESVTVQLTDHLHSDLAVDKYRLERITGAASSPSAPFDPYTRGTFWGKWLARNPYYTSYPAYKARIRQGAVGQPLDEMRVRNYIIDQMAVDRDGGVTFTLKDLFTKLDVKKAVAPLASKGYLSADITSSATSATLSPAGIGDAEYPASGWLAIGHEACSFTRSGDALTLVRAQLNTAAEAHSAQDKVQLVLAYVSRFAHDIAYDLLVGYSVLDAIDVDKVGWDAIAASAGMSNLYTAYVTEPTAVQDLVGELEVQAGFTLWPNLATGKVELTPLVPAAPSAAVDDAGWIVDGTLTLRRLDAKRLSEVWVYYGQLDPTKQLDEVTNFRSRVVSVDAPAEGPQQHGTAAVKEIFSRFIPQFGQGSATETAERLLNMFRDPPVEASFRLTAGRAGAIRLAAPFSLRTASVQDPTGATATKVHAPTAIALDEHEMTVTSQEIAFAAPSGVRRIFVDGTVYNVNLRALHDSLFSPPVGGETVQLTVNPNAVVGSLTADAAIRLGAWPAGVTLQLINNGEIHGKGGEGAVGGSVDLTVCPGEDFPFGSYSLTAGSAGATGGTALDATEHALTVTNNGAIRGGGGGGGGGGAAAGANQTWQPGGGGGGGRGSGPSAGGAIGARTNSGGCPISPYPSNLDALAAAGAGGTVDGGGGGGDGGLDEQSGVYTFGGDGGVGGDWGAPGAAGGAGSGGVSTSAGGAGGPGGTCTVGNANITWLATGTRQGALN